MTAIRAMLHYIVYYVFLDEEGSSGGEKEKIYFPNV